MLKIAEDKKDLNGFERPGQQLGLLQQCWSQKAWSRDNAHRSNFNEKSQSAFPRSPICEPDKTMKVHQFIKSKRMKVHTFKIWRKLCTHNMSAGCQRRCFYSIQISLHHLFHRRVANKSYATIQLAARSPQQGRHSTTKCLPRSNVDIAKFALSAQGPARRAGAIRHAASQSSLLWSGRVCHSALAP